MSPHHTNHRRIVAVVPAAGSGSRMGDPLPKQYLDINGLPMIVHTLLALAKVARIEQIVVVIAAEDAYWQTIVEPHRAALGPRVIARRVGGSTRAASVLNGLREVDAAFAESDWALVHDAARPCIRVELIEQFIDAIEQEQDCAGGLLALPVADTLKRGDGNHRVLSTIERQGLWRAQTPQMFSLGLLMQALREVPGATDEAQAMEALGHQSKLVVGDSANLKVTYATDMKLARILLAEDEA